MRINKNGHNIFFEFNSSSKNGKTNNIKKMLPFLDDEQLQELAQKIQENNGEYKGLRLEVLLPFMDDKNVDNLFLSRLEKGEDSHTFAPFVSDKVLDEMVKGCIEGSMSVKLTKYLPFLEDDTIVLLASKVTKEGEFCGLKLSTLMPFLDDAVIDKMLLDKIHSGGEYKFMLPFASDEALHSIITEYIDGKLDLDINPFMPFLEDEDIRRIFQYEMNKE